MKRFLTYTEPGHQGAIWLFLLCFWRFFYICHFSIQSVVLTVTIKCFLSWKHQKQRRWKIKCVIQFFFQTLYGASGLCNPMLKKKKKNHVTSTCAIFYSKGVFARSYSAQLLRTSWFFAGGQNLTNWMHLSSCVFFFFEFLCRQETSCKAPPVEIFKFYRKESSVGDRQYIYANILV